jgi:hypothetical protein
MALIINTQLECFNVTNASKIQEERVLKLNRVYMGFMCSYGIFRLLSKMLETCGLLGMEFLCSSEHHA